MINLEKRYRNLGSNPTLLNLLRAGCRVTMPDGIFLFGDPDSGYFEVGNGFHRFGLLHLTKDGLAAGLNDIEHIRKQQEEPDFPHE